MNWVTRKLTHASSNNSRNNRPMREHRQIKSTQKIDTTSPLLSQTKHSTVRNKAGLFAQKVMEYAAWVYDAKLNKELESVQDRQQPELQASNRPPVLGRGGVSAPRDPRSRVSCHRVSDQSPAQIHHIAVRMCRHPRDD